MGKLNLITNCVVNENEVFKDPKRTQIKKIIGVGNFTENKNILTLIKSVSKIQYFAKANDVQFNWYGDPSNYPHVFDNARALINENDINDIFFLNPPVSNIFDKYCENDALILCSLSEATPNVLCEAMVCGLPVLASNVGDIPNILNNKNELMFDPRSIDEIADKLLDFIKLTPFQVKKMSTNNIKIANSLFSLESFTVKWIDLIEGNTRC